MKILKDNEVIHEVDPEYGCKNGIVSFHGKQGNVIDTANQTSSELPGDDDALFEKRVYDEGWSVYDAAEAAGCKYVYYAENATYYYI